MAYSEGPWSGGRFLSIAKGKTLDSMAKIASDTTNTQFNEGSKIRKIGGKWYILSGDNTQYRVWKLDIDTNTISYLGALNAPSPDQRPHPNLIPVFYQGKTKFLMTTFDRAQLTGTYTHGNFYIFEAAEMENGYEFPIRVPLF